MRIKVEQISRNTYTVRSDIKEESEGFRCETLYAFTIQKLEKGLKIEANNFPELRLYVCDLEEDIHEKDEDDMRMLGVFYLCSACLHI